MDNGSRNKMTVDGKDCRISEQKPFWGGWKSHKFNGPALRYEVGVGIQSGEIFVGSMDPFQQVRTMI